MPIGQLPKNTLFHDPDEGHSWHENNPYFLQKGSVVGFNGTVSAYVDTWEVVPDVAVRYAPSREAANWRNQNQGKVALMLALRYDDGNSHPQSLHRLRQNVKRSPLAVLPQMQEDQLIVEKMRPLVVAEYGGTIIVPFLFLTSLGMAEAVRRGVEPRAPQPEKFRRQIGRLFVK